MMNENIDPETKRCLLCVRIPFEKLVETTMKLTDDKNKAYEIAEKASKLIRDTYLKDSFALCGKKPSLIIGASIWLSGTFTQKKICDKLQIDAAGLRRNAIIFMRMNPLLKPPFFKKGPKYIENKEIKDRTLEDAINTFEELLENLMVQGYLTKEEVKK